MVRHRHAPRRVTKTQRRLFLSRESQCPFQHHILANLHLLNRWVDFDVRWNVPSAYMTAFDGWVHDRSGVERMLEAEALLAMVSIALGLLAVRKLKAAGHLEREPVPALTR